MIGMDINTVKKITIQPKDFGTFVTICLTCTLTDDSMVSMNFYAPDFNTLVMEQPPTEYHGPITQPRICLLCLPLIKETLK